MTRQELDALRLAYDITMPAEYIRGCFFSKKQIQSLLNAHKDCSGLFFYVIPDPTKKAKFTMTAEAFDAKQKRYEVPQGIVGGDDEMMSVDGHPCPPVSGCPN